MLLPPDFVDLLKTAKKFTGPFAQAAPWQRYVILSSGNLYASNNRQIVEIKCEVEGSAIFTTRILDLLKTFQDPPATIEVGNEIRFGWENGRYLNVKNDFDHQDVVGHFVRLLDDWHGGDAVSTFDLGCPGRAIEIADGPRVVDGKLAPRNGFFYCSNGTPASRLVHGETDLRLDDLFQIKEKELKAARKANDRKRDRLLDEQVRIERELARVEQEISADEHRLATFENALEKYRRGDELDESEQDSLQPSCETLIHREESAEQKEAADELPKLPKSMKGWEQCGERNDGEYVYVTYRQRLPEPKARKVIRQRIETAVGTVFEPDFPREALVPAWKSLTQIEPRAGPG